LAQRHRRFFAKLTRQRLKRSAFRSVDDLKGIINRYIAETNGDPKPFVWTADPRRSPPQTRERREALEQGADALPGCFDAAFYGLAQQGLELGEDLLDRIEVRL
jgi:hypothetical protein